MTRFARCLACGAFGWLSVLGVHAQTTPGLPEKNAAPLVFYTGDGQFEIIALDAGAAQDALRVANSVWRTLAKPLDLPKEGFSSAVAVRLVPEAKWTEPAVFNVSVEPGGFVGVRIKWVEKPDLRIVRRALVQAVLLRQAVAWFGASGRLTVPFWLEQACTASSETTDRPAMLDALQEESAKLAPPSLEGLLRWQRGQGDTRGRELAAFWLFQHLQTEAGDDPRRWSEWLHALLGGADPLQALPRVYGIGLKDPALRELWWQVGFYNKRLTPTIPLMSAEDTRNWLADRCRWLAVKDGREQVLSFDDLWAARKERWIKAGLKEHTEQLQNQLLQLHPFYRNAAISLGKMYQAAVKGDEGAFRSAEKAVSQDAVDGREMETIAAATLDEIEAGR